MDSITQKTRNDHSRSHIGTRNEEKRSFSVNDCMNEVEEIEKKRKGMKRERMKEEAEKGKNERKEGRMYERTKEQRNK